MHRIGIIQGRLVPDENNKIQSFPAETWEKELMIAYELRFDLIEWVVDSGYQINSILSEAGVKKIKDVIQDKLNIHSVCCDFLMDLPLFSFANKSSIKANEILSILINKSCPSLNINIIELPLLGKSKVNRQHLEPVINFFQKINEELINNNIAFAIETDLTPTAYREFIDQLDDCNVMINYDVGNSAYWDFNMLEEFEQYGHKIGTIHIKDCTPKDYSVPFGSGNVDFDELFRQLKRINYEGDFILQGARGVDDKAIALGYNNFLEKYIKKYL